MSNITITQNDLSNPVLADVVFVDETLTLAAADELVAGTILARDSVSLKLVLYVKGGATNGNGIPKAILTYPVTTTAAGDVSVRVGEAGQYRFEKLVIDADGDSSNIDAAVKDQLRAYGMIPVSVKELNIADNS